MEQQAAIARLRAAYREIEPGQDVIIEPFRPEDAEGVALAYYATYGDAFPLAHVYDPGEIIRRNATDDQYTIVARTPRGEVVGLTGLFRHAPNPDVYEAGQLMVLKSYRQEKVGAGLAVAALDNLPRRFGLAVVFCEAVGNHPVSQQLALDHGLVFTGLEVECMPVRAYAKEGGVSHNVSLFLMFGAFRKAACGVHPPEAYRAFCEALYAQLRVPRHVLPGGPLTGETRASRFFLQETGLMRLTVSRPGRDLAEVVAAAEIEAGPRGVVQVFLNLGEAAAPQAAGLLRERGYFLGGLTPYWFGSDGLILQKLGSEPDWDAIKVCGPEAEALRAVIREDFERVRNGG